MATASRSHLDLKTSNLKAIKQADYSQLDQQQYIEIRLKRQQGLQHQRYRIKLRNDEIILEGFHNNQSVKASHVYYFDSSEPDSCIIHYAFNSPRMPIKVINQCLSSVSLSRQKQIIQLMNPTKAAEMIKALLLKEQPNALELLQLLPANISLPLSAEIETSLLSDLLDRYMSQETRNLAQVLPFIPQKIAITALNKLENHERIAYFEMLTLSSPHELETQIKSQVCIQLNFLDEGQLISIFTSSSPSVATELLKYLSEIRKVEVLTAIPPRLTAQILVCTLYIDTCPEGSMECDDAPWWVKEYQNHTFLDWIVVHNTQVTSSHSGITQPLCGFNECVKLLLEKAKATLVNAFAELKEQELAWMVQLENQPEALCINDLKEDISPQLCKLKALSTSLKLLCEYNSELHEEFDFLTERQPQQILIRLQRLDNKALQQFLEPPDAGIIINRILIPAIASHENAQVVEQELTKLINQCNAESLGYLLYHLIDFLPKHIIAKIEVNSIKCALMFMFQTLPENDEPIEHIRRMILLIPDSCKPHLIRFWQTRINLFCPSILDTLSTSDISVLFETVKNAATYFAKLLHKEPFCYLNAFLALPPHQQTLVNRNLPDDMWLTVAQQLPPQELHYWVDFSSELQTLYWLKQSQRPSLSELLGQASPEERLTLFQNIPSDVLLETINTMPAPVRLDVLSSTAFHPRLPEILRIWNQTHRYSLVETIRLSANANQTQLLLDTQDFVSLAISFAANKETHEQARIIQRAFKKYRFRRQLEFKIKKLDVIRMTNHQHKLTYYHRKNSRMPPMCAPNPEQQRIHGKGNLRGSYKVCQSLDNSFIKFAVFDFNEHNSPIAMAPSDTETSQEILEQLFVNADKKGLSFPSIAPGLQGQYTEHTDHFSVLIAARGGVSLATYTASETNRDMKVNVHSFKQLCEDISQAHQLGYFFRDIKPDNILYSEYSDDDKKVRLSRPQLHQIDLATLCYIPSPDDKQGKYRCSVPLEQPTGTASHFTQEIMEKKTEGYREGLQIADNYALLLTIFESVDPEFRRLEKNPCEFDAKIHPNIARAMTHTAKDAFTKGILHDESSPHQNCQIIMKVIEKYVKPQHQAAVILFLKDPVDSPLTHPIDKLIDWEVDDRDFLAGIE